MRPPATSDRGLAAGEGRDSGCACGAGPTRIDPIGFGARAVAGRRRVSSPGRHGAQGFSLLEIMVVVVLIALTVTLVELNLNRDLDRVAQLEARRFAKLVEHARDESVLSGKVYAVEVDERRKSYLFLESPSRWTPVRGDDILRERYFPEYLSVRFDLLQSAGEAGRKLLILAGTGDMTPFQLVVTGDRFLHMVKLDDAANLMVDRVERDAG